MMSHERAVRDTHTLVAQGLSPERHRALRDHLRGCDACMREYERLRNVEDALTPGSIMAPAAFERMSELVMEDVAPAPKKLGLSWIYGLSAATAMAVVMLLVVPRGDSEFTARGTTAPAEANGLSVFVIDATTRSASRAEVRDGRVSVPADRLLQLAYRATEERYLVVVGIDSAGDAQVYSNEATPLVAGAIDEPLPGAWDVGDVATPLRLFAVFSPTREAPESVVARAKSGSMTPTLLIDVVKR